MPPVCLLLIRQVCIVVKWKEPRDKQPDFKLQLCHYLDDLEQVTKLLCVTISLSVKCESVASNNKVIIRSNEKLLEVNEFVYIKHLGECLAQNKSSV